MATSENYVETYRQEVEEHLVVIEEAVLDLEDNPGNREALNRLFRSMHTIKGSGAMFGFEEIAGFTHHVESVLDRVRAGEVTITPNLINLVLASRDLIRTMLVTEGPLPAAEALQCEQVVAALQLLEAGDVVHVSAPAPSAAPPLQGKESTIWRIQFRPSKETFSSGLDPARLIDELRHLGNCTVTPDKGNLPDFGHFDPEICYLGWECLLETTASLDSIKDVFIFVDEASEVSITQIHETLDPENTEKPPRLGDILVERGDVTPAAIQDVLSKQKRIGELLVAEGIVSETEVEAALSEQKLIERHKAGTGVSSVRVPSAKLDSLINLVGELVIVQARLTQVSGELGIPILERPVEEIEQLTAELRDCVFNIRMLPIGTSFSKFRRLVRDLSVELGKEIQLETAGENTELDKTVIEKLDDPLMHLVRNSIDHGIEKPDLREKQGKARIGTVRLEAAQHGAHVVISISDDGAGLDRDAILSRAVERGLLERDIEYTDKEVFAQIFHPGFSTAAKVTSVSGRGVGMDVVKREVEALRGSINISSERGKGSRITLSLPLTLAIIDGLMVVVGDSHYVLPMAYVEECVEYGQDDMARTHGRNMIAVRGDLVPFVRLREFFSAPGDLPPAEQIVIVRVEEFRVGIACDRIVGSHQTVIKSLGKSYKNAVGVSGATILGDGSVALIIDIPALVKQTLSDERSMDS
ncbi:MAG TPA: chemotaxis protein CheA [Spirochaetota bacterium]|nr:chemotaxis protein CheA [Spirochaetota bacterium]